MLEHRTVERTEPGDSDDAADFATGPDRDPGFGAGQQQVPDPRSDSGGGVRGRERVRGAERREPDVSDSVCVRRFGWPEFDGVHPPESTARTLGVPFGLRKTTLTRSLP